jgi:hypothetical protein
MAAPAKLPVPRFLLRWPWLAPDLTTPWRLAAGAALVALVATVAMCLQDSAWLPNALGDTDDATRLVMVRDMFAGHGWWDQKITRLQPPVGLYMHWSRLLDGGLYLMQSLFRLFVSPRTAELWTRIVWPALWIVPAAGASLVIARHLGDVAADPNLKRTAVIASLILLCLNLTIYSQFRPGRVDHHDAQIALTLVALAGAVQRGPSIIGPLIAGLAGGVGLAIGLEALVFQALIGAAMGLRLVIWPRDRKLVQAYGLGMAFATVAAFEIQTPAWRWGVSACDALGLNLVAAVGLAGAGIALAASFTGPKARWFALGVLGLTALAAAGAYLGLDRNCLKGPFADVDPAIKPFWLDNVSEVFNFPRVWKARQNDAIATAMPPLMAAVIWLLLGLRKERRTDFAWWLSGAMLLAGMATGWTAIRMGSYPEWFAMALIAVGAAELARRYQPQVGVIAVIACALLLAPVGWTGASLWARDAIWPPKKGAASPADYCFSAFAYRDLAKLPAGLSLSEIDLGPFVLAHTPSSSISAPYHRMSFGIMQARRVLIAPVEKAEAMARAIGVTYVLECPMHKNHADRVGLRADALQARLDADKPPDWLERISPPKAPVILYRVRPAGWEKTQKLATANSKPL